MLATVISPSIPPAQPWDLPPEHSPGWGPGWTQRSRSTRGWCHCWSAWFSSCSQGQWGWRAPRRGLECQLWGRTQGRQGNRAGWNHRSPPGEGQTDRQLSKLHKWNERNDAMIINNLPERNIRLLGGEGKSLEQTAWHRGWVKFTGNVQTPARQWRFQKLWLLPLFLSVSPGKS